MPFVRFVDLARASALALGATIALGAAGPAAAQPGEASETNPPAPSASHQRMLALLQKIADDTPDTHPYIGDRRARQFREELRTLPATDTGPNRWRVMVQLSGEELRLGNEAEAIRLLTDALELIPRTDENRPGIDFNNYRLGVAYLRLAETQNCALHPNAEACILPLRGRGIHRVQTPSRRAIAAFTDVLRSTENAASGALSATTSGGNWGAGASPPAGNNATQQHLAARWLLNIAYMTVGGYPDEVPAPYRLPPETFQSAGSMPRFANVAPALGLDTFDMCGGAVADDFDNDGYLDIVVSTWDTRGQIRYFRNNRDGTFTERTAEAGLLGLYGGLNLVQADYDNDGDVDLLVLRGAWLRANGRHPNSLLRNDGTGTFTDVTFDAGLGAVHYPSPTAAWGDYDNDGDLDLYVGNESSRALVAPSQLFHNNGDGTFTDVAEAAAVMNFRYAKAATWGDYDGDGRQDLYVSNYRGGNRLYRNTGRGFFIDEAPRLGVAGPTGSFPAWFWDVDNDGLLDLYVSAYTADIEHLAASALGRPAAAEASRLYRGTPGGRFVEVGGRYGLTEPTAAMGSNFGDLDNDGYPDFYLGTGYPPYHSVMPNVMYRNRRGRGFSNVTYAGGFGHLQKGHGVVFADLDHDGDQDVFQQMGGAFPGDRFGNALYENPGFGNHWITIELEGVRSNRSAIGARIRAVVAEEGGGRRSIYRHVNSGGSFGGNPLRQTLGLGGASRIERLDILWPATGVTQTFTDLPADQAIHIVEGESSYSTLGLPSFTFASTEPR
jgi:hypothetical protein